MQEDFLHYLWKFKKFDFAHACTETKQPITLVHVGQHNKLSGPDFFNAKLHIGNQLWAGNVEIHLKSSDWYAHHHETDAAYDNVILHVVWEHDVAIFRKDNTTIPTLELQKYVSQRALDNYTALFKKTYKRWINCEDQLQYVPKMIQANWLERLYFERLASKTTLIDQWLTKTQFDWEQVLFQMLARNFGTKVNGAAFQSIAASIDFSIVRKCSAASFQLEALLLGLGGILPDETFESYPLQLIAEYEFIKHKYQIDAQGILPVQFFKLRPTNFPTIRLSQLAQLYCTHQNLFQLLMETKKIADFYALFKVQASPFWDTHYSFAADHKAKPKKLSKSFMDLIFINTVIPLKFAYASHHGKEVNEEILAFISAIKPEANNIIKKFNMLREKAENAQETQALIELKTNYCDLNKCLQCGHGSWLLGRDQS